MWMLLGALAAGAPLPVSPDSCVECHASTVAQWRQSRHSVASTNAVFSASWEHWPNGWCLGCHAPGPDQQIARLGTPAVAGVVHWLPRDPPDPRWGDGVDCVACHMRDGVLRTSGHPEAAARAMHPIEHDPQLGDERLCARCHEFALQRHTPRMPFAYGKTPAQATVSEWRVSEAASQGLVCQDCHMGEHGHRFPGAHDRELVRGALSVQAVEQPDGRVLAVVLAEGAAHSVPTGDPFRTLVLELCADEACTESVAEATLRRVFAVTEASWELFADRTVPPQTGAEPARRELTLDPRQPARWWRLYLRFGDARFEAKLPASEVGYLVAEGPVERR